MSEPTNDETPAPTPPEEMVMPFGKYRGKPLRDIPLGYLTWLATSAYRWPEIQKAASVVTAKVQRARRDASIDRQRAARDPMGYD